MYQQERILCAAIWYKDLIPVKEHHCKPRNIDGKGIVLCGWRHGDVISQMLELKGLRTIENDPEAVGDHEQGFLTSKNRFVDREGAMVIAIRANQLLAVNFTRGNELFSEDIY